MSFEDSGKAVLLDGGWNVITGKLNILKHDRMETRVFEATNWLNLNVAFLDNSKLCDPVEG
jgi:hypothetical protein